MMSSNLFLQQPWRYACEPFQMTPHVYYVGNRDVGSYLIDTGAGLVLIDQGYAETLYHLLESIRRLGFDPRDIRALLVSHAHVDHCGGTRLLKEYTGAPVWISREDMAMYQKDVRLVHLGNENWIDFQPDYFYDYDRPFCMGNLVLEVVHTPGHTPGTCSFFWTDQDAHGEKYRMGLYGGIGLNTQQEDFLRQYPDWPKSLLGDFIRSIRSCQNRTVDITLPSHPNHTAPALFDWPESRDISRFVNRQVWSNMLQKRLEMALALENSRREKESGSV